MVVNDSGYVKRENSEVNPFTATLSYIYLLSLPLVVYKFEKSDSTLIGPSQRKDKIPSRPSLLKNKRTRVLQELETMGKKKPNGSRTGALVPSFMGCVFFFLNYR